MELIEVKYKQTEVGLIPQDWTFDIISDQIDLLTGFPFPSSKYSADGIRLLKGANVKRGETDWQENLVTYWNEDINKYKQFELKADDLVIAMDGSLVGRSYALLSKSDLPALLLQRVARIRSKKIDIKFLKFFVGSDWFVKYCDSVKTVTAIPHISPKDIRYFKIPLPPTLEEQKAIATALSDVDELITNLEKLIIKKKAIKQGAMQQLLTPPHKGGKRLEGFDGEWKEIKLGEIADFYKGKGLPKSDIVEGGSYKCIHYGELFTKYNQIITNVKSRTNQNINVFLSKKNDVLMPTSDVTPNGLATASVIFENDIILGGDVLVIRPYKNLYGGFLSYQVSINKQQIMSLISGTTVFHLYGSDMAKFSFYFPDFEEQKAIVDIINDIDIEIEKLETKKSKYQSVKQGMMQELLTGKTRLI